MGVKVLVYYIVVRFFYEYVKNSTQSPNFVSLS